MGLPQDDALGSRGKFYPLPCCISGCSPAKCCYAKELAYMLLARLWRSFIYMGSKFKVGGIRQTGILDRICPRTDLLKTDCTSNSVHT